MRGFQPTMRLEIAYALHFMVIFTTANCCRT